MKFAVPMIWKKQQYHVDDCYLCLAQLSSGINWYMKRKVYYPDLNSAQFTLPHSDIFPVPIPPQQKACLPIFQNDCRRSMWTNVR